MGDEVGDYDAGCETAYLDAVARQIAAFLGQTAGEISDCPLCRAAP